MSRFSHRIRAVRTALVSVLIFLIAFPLSALAPRYDEALKLFHEGQFDASLEVIRAVFDDNKGAIELRLLAAHNYLGKKDFENARAHMDYCMQQHPDRFECRAVLSTILREQGKSGTALQVLATAIRKFPDAPELRLEAAAAHFALGSYGTARTHLEKVIAADSRNFAAIYMDGLIFLKQRQYSNAEFRLQNALDLKPKNKNDLVNLYVNLGFAYEGQGDALVNEGKSADAAGRFREALRYYTFALRLDPDNETARKNRVRVEAKEI